MPEVFIIYAWDDREVADKLYRDLRGEGYDAWIDSHNLLPGSKWPLEIRRAIRTSEYVIVLLSNESVSKRGYINKEIREAISVLDELPDGQIFLIPARLEDCRPTHERLNELTWVDLFPDYSRGLVDIIRALKRRRLEPSGAVTKTQEHNSTVRLRGDPAQVPGKNESLPQAFIATRKEWIYDIVQGYANGEQQKFFDYLLAKKAGLVPAGTLVEILDRVDHRGLKLVHVKLLEGDWAGHFVWTLPHFIP